MNVITSAQNPIIKRLRQLATSSKFRRDENQAIAEGAHLVQSFLDTDAAPAMVVCAESALNHPEIAALLQSLSPLEPIVITDGLFESIASIHAAVGILIVFTPPIIPAQERLQNDIVLLEEVQDPGNLGTLLRTAAAAGVGQVALSAGCASPWSPKALRAGMGAQFSLHVTENADLNDLVHSTDLPVYTTVLSEDAQSLYQLDLTQPAVWIFGSEGQGVSEALAKAANTHVIIPQTPGPVESLNVAAAAAVCLYEQYRQRL